MKNKKINLKLPEISEMSIKKPSKEITYITKNCEKEDVVAKLIELHELFPNKLVHDLMFFPIMKLGMNGELVCPVGLFDYDSNFYVDLETAAAKYHVLPYEGAYLDQPQDIIEAFNVIRSAEARYNNYQMNQIKQKSSIGEANSPKKM